MNVLENPDFQEVSGTTPEAWYGFGYCTISIARGVKFKDGKNCCLCTDRKHAYSAIGQDVAYAVENGMWRDHLENYVKSRTKAWNTTTAQADNDCATKCQIVHKGYEAVHSESDQTRLIASAR